MFIAQVLWLQVKESDILSDMLIWASKHLKIRVSKNAFLYLVYNILDLYFCLKKEKKSMTVLILNQ